MRIYHGIGRKMMIYKMIMFWGSAINKFRASVKLTVYQTTPIFSDPLKKKALKTLWEKEKMLVTSIFSFPTVFSTLS